MIDTMYFSQPEGERVQTSGTANKTASIALNYRERMERINQEWYEHLEKEYLDLTEELRFFESAVKSVSGMSGTVLLIWSSVRWPGTRWQKSIISAEGRSATTGQRLSWNWKKCISVMTMRSWRIC